MRENTRQALRVVALGEFADAISPLAPRLAAFDVTPLRVSAVEQLPERLGGQDILLTELAWLSGLPHEQRDELARRASGSAGWIALTDPLARFKDQVAWQRLGVSHFIHTPLDPDRLAGLVEDIHDRHAGAPIRVILLDDEESSLAYYGAVLRHGGIEVLSVQDPLLVLESLDTHKPDVLVLDIEMPGCRGPELATIVRQFPAYARLPVLFLTAMESMQDKLLARAAAAEDFLAKPVAPELLLAAVEAHALRYRALLRSEALCQRQQAQARMQLEQLRQAVNAHAIVSIADAQGNIVHVNDKFCAISGYTRKELLGQNHRLIQSGLHEPAFYENLWRTILGGRIWHGEVCNRRKDGPLYWVEATIFPVLDSRGAPRQFISIRTDITAIKAAEAAQREQNLMRTVLTEAAAQLLPAGPDALDGAIEQSLRRAGEYLGADRAYLFRFCDMDAGGQMCNTHEWCAPGIAPQKESLQHLPVENFAWWWAQMQQGGMINIPDVAALPAESAAEKALLERQDIRALCAFPLHHAGKVVGFIGFDQVGKVRDWDTRALELLCLLAGLISSALLRTESERAAEAARERLRRGQIYANIGTWDWNIPTGELYWTERIAPLFGYPAGDLETSYENFLAAVHPEDRQAVIDAVAACVERDAPYEIEHRVVWPDGTVRWLLERGSVQRDAAGCPMRMIGVVQDIDARKRAEAALAVREKQLLEAQRMAAIGNWSADLKSGELLWSDEIYRIFGHEPGSFAPSVAAFHAAVHPDDRALVSRSEARAEKTGRHDVVHRIVRPDGSIRHVHELAQMQLDATGKPLGMTGTVQDITERVKFEQALIEAREAADRANQAKSDFLSSMSHELRTPMNAIIGFAQMLEYDSAMTADQQDNVHEILKAGRHLLELINEVLDLARIESGRVDLSMEGTDLVALGEDCRHLVQPIADQAGIELHFELPAGCAVFADRVRLKQVLLNLLSNAIKYNRPRGKVRLCAEPGKPGHLRLAVADTGQGIAAERIKDLFQPFNRLGAEATEIEGTGIGLTITRRLVEMMGGEIGVESTVGAGSTFWVELALCQTETVGPGATASDSHAPLSAGREPATVLAIDDNPANLKLIAQVMGTRDHIHLLSAHTPELGIEQALAHRPDLILLDINMPDMNGYQVLEIFKANPVLRKTPVIAITANAMPSDIERGKAAGFADYLTKPLDIARFLATLDRCLADCEASDPGSRA